MAVELSEPSIIPLNVDISGIYATACKRSIAMHSVQLVYHCV